MKNAKVKNSLLFRMSTEKNFSSIKWKIRFGIIINYLSPFRFRLQSLMASFLLKFYHLKSRQNHIYFLFLANCLILHNLHNLTEILKFKISRSAESADFTLLDFRTFYLLKLYNTVRNFV